MLHFACIPGLGWRDTQNARQLVGVQWGGRSFWALETGKRYCGDLCAFCGVKRCCHFDEAGAVAF